MNNSLIGLTTLTSALALTGCQPSKTQTPKPKKKAPNVLFILVDDLGWKDVGYNGSTLYETPNVDKFAANSMIFNNAYAACPVCSPTRASLLTGKYPARLGITNWIPELGGPNYPGRDIHLPLSELTIAESFKSAGYRTGFLGKWHLGGRLSPPSKNGFDMVKGGLTQLKYFSPYNLPTLKDGPKGEYMTDRLGSEAVTFIKDSAKKDKPFFLYLSFFTVHTPIQPRTDLVPKYKTKVANQQKPDRQRLVTLTPHNKDLRYQDNPNYAAMVSCMDLNVGKVLASLKEAGVDKNTIVVFYSDNGGLSSHSGPTSNYPLRNGKGWTYEGGIRVPLAIRWPGVTKGGTTSNQLVTTPDFYPTLLQMTNLPLNPKQHVDGKSIVPILKGKNAPIHDAIYWHYPHRHGSGHRPSGAIRCGDWKLIQKFETNTIELYNLKNDIGETKDLSKSNPTKTAELLAKLKKWQKEVNAKGVPHN